MQMRFGADQILGHRILPDGSAVGIMFRTGEDDIELLVPTQNVQAMFTLLADIMTAISNITEPLVNGQRVNARFPTTVAVSISPETKPPSVVLVFDANRPTMTAMCVSTAAARTMSKALKTKAREATELAAKPFPALPAPAATQDQQ